MYFVSCGCRASKHLAGLGGATISEPRLLVVLDLSILGEPSAAERRMLANETQIYSLTEMNKLSF